MKKIKYVIYILFVLNNGTIGAETSEKSDNSLKPQMRPELEFFVDLHRMQHFFDISQRSSSYSTQPIENQEFVLNHAYAQGSIDSKRFRGQLALHTGSYVAINYAAEPQIYRNILRANGGFQIIDNLWLDAGVFDSHIGMESGVSRDNPTVTRSLMADLSPFFETGLSVSYETKQFSAKLLAINGWQRIKDNNKDIGLGTQIQFKPADHITLNSSTYYGNEQDTGHRPRVFHNFYVQHAVGDFSYAFAFDIGAEKSSSSSNYLEWWGTALILRYALSEEFATALRLEHYHDRHQVIVTTNSRNGFQTSGASVNFDYTPMKQVLLRLEVRWLNAKDKIFQDANQVINNDAFILLSTAFTF